MRFHFKGIGGWKVKKKLNVVAHDPQISKWPGWAPKIDMCDFKSVSVTAAFWALSYSLCYNISQNKWPKRPKQCSNRSKNRKNSINIWFRWDCQIFWKNIEKRPTYGPIYSDLGIFIWGKHGHFFNRKLGYNILKKNQGPLPPIPLKVLTT